MFGHIKGAFTGAVKGRDGAFVTADSGILFLDEIAELPAEVQAKCLRVLEDGWVTPEGSDEPRRVDVRVVAATNRDLPSLIRRGQFRADLYHRLDVLQIQVPALRDHIDDVGFIAERLLPRVTGEKTRRLKPDEVEQLKGYEWPGNVRQLIKVLKRVVLLGDPMQRVLDEERRLGSLQEDAEDGGAPSPLWPCSADELVTMDEVRSAYAARALQLKGGNYKATAEALKIAPNTLRSYVQADR